MVTPIIERQRRTTQLFTEILGDQIRLEMIGIPAGTFTMGSPSHEESHEDNEGPEHRVSISRFFMGRYPVTQAQWEFVAQLPTVQRDLEPQPSYFKGTDLPVEQISWYEAQEFCHRLSAHTQHPYRLPSEAEWEYACRGGTTTPFYCGATITPEIANYDGNYAYGQGPTGEYRSQTTPVTHFPMSNPFGLHDMHGNVWEWCQDHWHNTYQGAPADGRVWLDEDNNDNYSHVLRGGSWVYDPRSCRSASRLDLFPDARYYFIGFRVVLAPR